MNKCTNCNGCLTNVWITTHYYKYCDFCRKYFRREGTKWIEASAREIENMKFAEKMASERKLK